ncbi:unnamed protein product [Eruca vesicaria subsp. sativa]|uniref:BZIP domain-containing protein n=1 Tax=Eruca vesicaria subsp. sativa TaxID=29727 RepID=A0ABC8KJ70_ERUVS|nr:unnamed protein product [Eruca vesicaria subsp. sativa]
MTQRPNSNPSLSRFPLPFTGNRVGTPPPPPPPFPPFSQPMEERNDAGYSPSLPPSPFSTMHHSTSTVVVAGGGRENLPPRKSHRRSNSDVTFAMMPRTLINSPIPSKSLDRSIISGSDWSSLVKDEPRQPESESSTMDDIIRAYINLDNVDALNSFGKTTEIESIRGARNSTDSEVEGTDNVKGLKRRAGGGGGDIAPPTSRHYRSVSMDSSFIPKLNFGDEKLPLPSIKVSPTNSGDANSNAAYSVSAFSAADMKKISADVKLAEIFMVDPKRVRRMLKNRASAARSKERKTQKTAELQHKVQTLQNENFLLSAQLTNLQRDSIGLQNENRELKFRLQAMEQQAQLRDALSERLTEEVQRLRLVTGEPSRSMESKTSLSPEMFPQQLRISQLQQQQHSNQNSTMKAYLASTE